MAYTIAHQILTHCNPVMPNSLIDLGDHVLLSVLQQRIAWASSVLFLGGPLATNFTEIE